MMITSYKPYTREEIEKLKEQFDVYIKIVIDIKKRFVLPVATGTTNLRKYY